MKSSELKKDDFEREYLLGKTYEEMSAIFGLSIRQLKRLNSTKFHIKRTKEQNAKFIQSNLERKFGENYLTEFAEKRKKTYFEKTGYENPSNNPEVRSKREKTNIEKFGVKNPFAAEGVKSKIKKQFETKYGDGITNPSQVKSIKRRKKISKIITKNDYEKEIFDFILSLELSSQIEGRPGLVCFLNKSKIGIIFHYSEISTEDFDKHSAFQEQSLKYLNSDEFLYHIYEYEWIDKKQKEKIKSHLKDLLVNPIIIYARKCIIKEISASEKSSFLNHYHLQGNDSSNYRLGLFYNDELLMVMTFCKARFTSADYEISRMCTKAGYSVIGGANKLFKFYLSKIQAGSTIVSYNSIGKTKGGVYPKLGFTLKAISKPGYIWWKENNIISRYKIIKYGLKNEIKTMQDKGYKRIFDSGNNVWIYTKK